MGLLHDPLKQHAPADAKGEHGILPHQVNGWYCHFDGGVRLQSTNMLVGMPLLIHCFNPIRFYSMDIIADSWVSVFIVTVEWLCRSI